MKVYRLLEGFLLKCINAIWKLFILIHEYKNIFKKRKIFKNVKLTREQKNQIDTFYKENYGKKIKYWWHRLYMSYTGKFDYKYLPEYIFSIKMEPKVNNRVRVLPFENKNMLQVLFNSNIVKIPETYIMCVNGKYFDGKRNPISKENAINILKNKNNGNYDTVIKISVDSSSGRGVKVLELKDGVDKKSKKNIAEIFDEMGNNFVVQERLIPHERFAKIYPNAINTLRVITYLTENEIKVAPVTMRIGQGGAKVDNAHAGGMFIAVNDEGKLAKEAFTEYQKRYTKHPNTGVIYENYQLPCIDKVKRCAIELHKKLPMLEFISWDFTIDKDENVVLIETNLHSQTVWFPQMAHGKAFFGDDTSVMLQNINKKVRKK